jgi:hypothetical protein
MSGDDTEAGGSEFERRMHALLVQSADELPGAVRSRLWPRTRCDHHPSRVAGCRSVRPWPRCWRC